MRERSEEEQPPTLKTYSLEMTLITLYRDYNTYSSHSLFAKLLAILPRHVTLSAARIYSSLTREYAAPPDVITCKPSSRAHSDLLIEGSVSRAPHPRRIKHAHI